MTTFDRQAVHESLSRLVTPGIKLTALADELGVRKHEYSALRAIVLKLVEAGAFGGGTGGVTGAFGGGTGGVTGAFGGAFGGGTGGVTGAFGAAFGGGTGSFGTFCADSLFGSSFGAFGSFAGAFGAAFGSFGAAFGSF